MIYLDNASTSFPKPESVYSNMDSFYRKYGGNPGRGGHKLALKAEKLVADTRATIAGFFNINTSERVIFTLNTTDALNVAIKGFIKDGDNVVTTTLEHNSVLRPLKRLEEEGKITVTYISFDEYGFVNPEDFKKSITDKTSLVILTHASNVLGTIQPVKKIGEIARKKGKTFLVDAAQTAGKLKIDVQEMGIDMLAFPGHKGLLGPAGTGGLYVSGSVNLKPWREGGTGIDSESLNQPEGYPFWLESGTPNLPGIAGLKAAVEYINGKGIEKIKEKERGLTLKLIEGLRRIKKVKLNIPYNKGETVSTISFNIDGIDPSVTGGILDNAFDIAVRTGIHCAPLVHKKIGTSPGGTVRVSPGYFTTAGEIEEFLSAVSEIVRV